MKIRQQLKFGNRKTKELAKKFSIALMAAGLLSPAVHADAFIASGTSRTTPVLLVPGSPDYSSLNVAFGGLLTTTSPDAAVFMDGGTFINNAGTIMRNGGTFGDAALVVGTVIANNNSVAIFNAQTGIMQWVNSANNGLNRLFDFTAAPNMPVTIYNAGSMTGSEILGATGSASPLLAIYNTGTINTRLISQVPFGVPSATRGDIFIQNSNILNMGGNAAPPFIGGIVSLGNLTINNSGVIDFVNPSVLESETGVPLGNNLLIGTSAAAGFNGTLILNNSGSIGLNSFVTIGGLFGGSNAGDIILYNSGRMGGATVSATAGGGVFINPGPGPNGSTIINSELGTISNVLDTGIPGLAITFAATTRPSTLVNTGRIVGNITASPTLQAPTTINVGGPFAVIMGNITSTNPQVQNTLNIVGNFNYGGIVNGIRNINVQGGTFTLEGFTSNSVGPAAIRNFFNMTIAGGAVANINAPVTGGLGATLVNNGTLNLRSSFIDLPGGTITNNGYIS